MRAVVDIAAVELRRFLRDRANIFFVFLFPLVLIVLIGSQFGGEGPEGRVAVSGPDGDLRQVLVEELRADGVEVWFDDAGTIRELLARGRADVGLFLTGEDETAYDAGDAVDLEVVTAGQATAPVVLQRVRTVVGRVALDDSQVAALTDAGVPAEEARTAIDRAAESGVAPDVEVVDVNEVAQEFEGLGQFDVGAATQLLLFVFLSSLTGASTLILTRRQGVLARTVAAPVSVRQVLAGQALGRFTLAMVQGVYLVIGTALLFDVDWGSWPATLLVLAVFALVSAAAAMVIGAVMDHDGAAVGVGIGAGLVLGALGGCMTPLEFFPDTLQRVAHVTPHAWAYEAYAEIQRHDGGVLDVLPQVGVLAGMAAALMVAGTWLLRRSLDRAL